MERARARGAAVLGEVLGYGETNDAYHVTRPEPEGEGAARAMRRALEDAGLPASELGYVNAHGTGTPANDRAEACALRSVLGNAADVVPVSSTKGHVGHCLGAAGALEAGFTWIALRHGLLPATLNLERPDPAFALDFIRGEPRRSGGSFALSNSFGFGGMNACVVLGTGEALP
jgi:3-oxoacyl-[acyl-carrier-protein] synthase II